MSKTQVPLERDRIEVGLHDVYAVLEGWTGIPSDRLAASGFSAGDLAVLSDVLSGGIFGQERAIESCVSGLRRRFQLPERSGERRPIWTALFAGPSGVGKTQLACELATHFFGDLKNHLVKVDLSEFREEHIVSRLVGSPPGYIGHGEGGELTNALRKCRTGVLVLDEVEKAHPSILTTVILPMLGEAVVHDMNDGRVLDVSNMVVILTTNLGTNRSGQQPPGFSAHSQLDETTKDERGIRTAIAERFPREVLGRLDDVVVFEPLSEPAARAIWRREVIGLEQRLASRGLTLHIDVPEDVETICLQQIQDGIRQQGARAVIRLFDRAVADKCLDLTTGDGVAGASSFRVERVGEDGLRYSLLANAVL